MKTKTEKRTIVTVVNLSLVYIYLCAIYRHIHGFFSSSSLLLLVFSFSFDIKTTTTATTARTHRQQERTHNISNIKHKSEHEKEKQRNSGRWTCLWDNTTTVQKHKGKVERTFSYLFYSIIETYKHCTYEILYCMHTNAFCTLFSCTLCIRVQISDNPLNCVPCIICLICVNINSMPLTHSFSFHLNFCLLRFFFSPPSQFHLNKSVRFLFSLFVCSMGKSECVWECVRAWGIGSWTIDWFISVIFGECVCV